MDIITLYTILEKRITMENAKKLGFGLMRLPILDPNKDSSIDIETTSKMVDMFLERGFTYFDTAWMYHSFESERAIKKALVDRHPRESYTLTTKLHGGFIKNAEDPERIFNEQMEKTGVSYFDYYLIHDVNHNTLPVYDQYDCWNFVLDKKEKGFIKNVGFSFHSDPETLEKTLIAHPEFEYVQLQINYLDWESNNVQSRKCYELCEKYNRKVIVMEPVRGGALASLPEYIAKPLNDMHPDWTLASWAVRFAASHKNIFMVLSGMSNLQQLDNNTSYMADFAPLSDEEIALLLEAGDKIRKDIAVPCTGCSYCTDGCPMQIAIPKYFAMLNHEKKIIKEWGWQSKKAEYNELCASFGKASECIHCGQCESMCPQHLPIIEHLQTVAATFEE